MLGAVRNPNLGMMPAQKVVGDQQRQPLVIRVIHLIYNIYNIAPVLNYAAG